MLDICSFLEKIKKLFSIYDFVFESSGFFGNGLLTISSKGDFFNTALISHF